MQLFGGDLAGNLVYPAVPRPVPARVRCAPRALPSSSWSRSAPGMLGSVAPVPGGIGVQEAAVTALMTSFGVSANVAPPP